MTAMEISRLDDRMLQLADTRSPAEISQQLGGVISPTRVASRIKELLETRDWLTDAQQDALVVHKMRKVLVRLEEAFASGPNDLTDLDNAKVQLAFLKAIGDRLDVRKKATEVDLNTYHVNVGREMARAYDIALSYMKGALRAEVDTEAWDEAAKEALTHASAELSKNAVDGEGNSVTSLAA